MTMPQFTAAASSQRSVRGYAVRPPASRRTGVVPAERLTSACGLCSCDPGKCCEQTLFGCECFTCGTSPASRLSAPIYLKA